MDAVAPKPGETVLIAGATGGVGALAIQYAAAAGARAVVHLAGDGTQLAGLLTPDGRLASTIGFGPDQHPAATSIVASPEARAG